MDELLAQNPRLQLKGFKRGDQVEGTITQKISKSVLIDIGAKTEGQVTDREYQAAATFIKDLKVGDKVTVRVVSPETDTGQILLSLRDIARDQLWQKLTSVQNQDEIITVQIEKANQGGLIVRLDQLMGFIPTSHLGKDVAAAPEKLIGTRLKVKVLEADPQTNRLIFSEKAVSEAKEIEKTKQALGKIKVDQVYTGKIVGIVPFGLFVSISVPVKPEPLSVEGLVHISEISWEKVENLEELFSEGDEVEVKVIGVNIAAENLSLSLKALQEDPFEKLIKKYPKGKSATGTVTQVNEYGAFVELEPGIEGLIHISKIPADKSYKVGDSLPVTVEAVDQDKHRLSLEPLLTTKPIGYK